MISIRKAEERGHADLGWLNSYHTFSFGSYHDERHMGFRALRVLNQDRVAPGKGFGAHGHRDMEILSYVLSGTLAHTDSMGEEHLLRPNEVQVMSAGTGVIHSEFNGSDAEPVHFLQMWITPATLDLDPSYQQVSFDPEEKHGRLRLIAGPNGASQSGAVMVHQDSEVYASALDSGGVVEYDIPNARYAWVHCATGAISINGVELRAGDGAAITDERHLTLRGESAERSEIVLFDLA
jgi:redox-sensitive bicupin YhaK (pirin superfamily)